MHRKNWMGGAAVLALLLVGAAVWAAELASADSKSTVSKISVSKMHCPVCAKKITAKLKEITGVADAQADVKAGVVSVTPKKGKTLSPRALWEAVEQAKYTPTRLEGPSGTFKSKPKS